MFRLLILFITSFFALNLNASPASDTLTQLLSRIQTMQADFTQTIVDKSGRPLEKSYGKMAMQRPGKFRWDVMRPNQQLIVTNSKRLWIYDPDLSQVTIRTLTTAAGEAPALLLSNTTVSLENEFNVQTVASPSLQWFVLTPRDKSSMLRMIKLGFTSGQINQMQLQDHLGHNTVIQFKHVRSNAALSSSLFNFRPPAKVDVIDETKH